jgi:hypothetical protein
MRIHLIRTKDVDTTLLEQVAGLLQAVPGPMEIIFNPEIYTPGIEIGEHISCYEPEVWEYDKKIEPQLTSDQFIWDRDSITHWSDFYLKCRKYRSWQNVPRKDMVIILTGQANQRNWFSALDSQNGLDGFVHTGDWEAYIPAPPAFPIAYEVISLALQQNMYKEWNNLKDTTHRQAIGCMNDFCKDKADVILKLRTADICHECLAMFERHYPLPVIHHVLQIMESLRVQMLYSQNFRQSSPLSRLVIDADHRIYLPDFGNIEIRLTPLEKALYLLFIRHPEGIMMSSIQDHRAELYNLYTVLANQGDATQMQARVNDLSDPAGNSASEKMSKIKQKFEQTIGKTLAASYYIQGPPGEAKKIGLERGMVVWEG